MKLRKLSAIVVLIIVLTLLLAGCASKEPVKAPAEAPKAAEALKPAEAPKAQEMKPVVLSFAHFFPASHPIHTDWVEGWAKGVEEATNGLVKVNTFPGETLLRATEIYDGVVQGSADIGLSCPCYNFGRFPVLEALIQPAILYQSDKVASNVAWDFTQAVNPDELKDTKVLTMLATGPGAIWSNKPIQSLADLQGKEVRVTGVHVPFIKALGATPVAMPQSEAYEALQRGIVDANLGPTGMLKAFRQAEVAKYVTITPFIYNCLYYTTMNLDVWNSFPPDIQEAIIQVTEKLFHEVGAGLMDRDNDEGLRWSVKEQGMQVINLSSEEQQKWIDMLVPLQDEWVKKVDGMGLPGRELLNKVLGLAEKYDKKFH